MNTPAQVVEPHDPWAVHGVHETIVSGAQRRAPAIEVTVFSIPFDAPNFVGRRAVVHTDTGMLRGMVRTFSVDGMDMIVELADGRTRLRHLCSDQVRVVALA